MSVAGLSAKALDDILRVGVYTGTTYGLLALFAYVRKIAQQRAEG
jgi:hypothetical protein